MDACTFLVAMVYLDRIRTAGKTRFEFSDPGELYLSTLIIANKYLHVSNLIYKLSVFRNQLFYMRLIDNEIHNICFHFSTEHFVLLFMKIKSLLILACCKDHRLHKLFNLLFSVIIFSGRGTARIYLQ